MEQLVIDLPLINLALAALELLFSLVEQSLPVVQLPAEFVKELFSLGEQPCPLIQMPVALVKKLALFGKSCAAGALAAVRFVRRQEVPVVGAFPHRCGGHGDLGVDDTLLAFSFSVHPSLHHRRIAGRYIAVSILYFAGRAGFRCAMSGFCSVRIAVTVAGTINGLNRPNPG